MGYVAILEQASGSGLEVDRLHVNLWALPGLLPGRKLLYFDIGVLFHSAVSPLDGVQILLPFMPDERPWAAPNHTPVLDLFSTLADAAVAELVFGEPLTQQGDDQQRTVTLASGPSFNVVRVDAGGVSVVRPGPYRSDLTLWNIPLSRSIAIDERAYVRLRFCVFSSGGIWRWIRSWRSRLGATVDLRVSDVREGRDLSTERPLRPRIVDVSTLDVLVMTDRRMRIAVTSPELRYVRTLEGETWQKYLAGSAYRGSVDGMIACYWRHPSLLQSGTNGAPISIQPDTPFRGFLSLTRQRGHSFIATLLAFGAAVGIFLGIYRVLRNTSIPNVNFGWILAFLGLTAISGIASAIKRVRTMARTRALAFRQFSRAAERRLLRRG